MHTLRGHFDTKFNTYTAAQEPMIFHCHHYNTVLQATLEDTRDYIDIYPILVDSAQEIVYSQLTAYFAEANLTDFTDRKGAVEDFFAFCGYGKFALDNLTPYGGKIIAEADHYSYGWKVKFGLRADNLPMVSFFTCGFLAGATDAIFNLPLGTSDCKQLTCYTKGDAFPSFEITKLTSPKTLIASPKLGKPQTHTLENPTQETDVNYLGIREALTNMPIEGTTTKGMIDAFGVLLTRMFANYYCQISYKVLKKLEIMMRKDGLDLADELLTEAGHNCAFYTFGGVMESAEWNGMIKPMCKTKEDWVHGIVAVVNSFGWGFWEILELIPAEKLVIKVTNGYEATSYLAAHGNGAIPISFLAKGATMGIMNLLYNGDVTTNPNLNEDYYNAICRSDKMFSVTQTACRTMGANADVFEAVLLDK